MNLPLAHGGCESAMEKGQIDGIDESQISFQSITRKHLLTKYYDISKFRAWWHRISESISKRIFTSHDGQTSVRKLEDCPLGYPRVAAFMDSDENFMIYRRFGFLYSRILLHKQDELRQIEDNLDSLDYQDSRESDESRKCLKSRSKDVNRKERIQTEGQGYKTRKELLQEAEEKVGEYSQILLQAQQLVAMNRPAARDRKSLQIFMENGFLENGEPIRPLLKADTEFVYQQEDLVTLRPGRESAWLDAIIERMLKMVHCKPVQYVFCSKGTRAKTDYSDIRYFSKDRVDRFVTLIISFIILVLLVVPIYSLYRISSTLNSPESNASCIGILLVATLVFSAVLSLFTKAKRHEILGASAA